MMKKVKQLIKNMLFWIAPEVFWRQAQFELMMFGVRLGDASRRRKYAEAKDLMINFGAGAIGKPGWVNVDGVRKPGINCLCDGRGSFPFASNSARCIFTEHFFEHIDYYREAPSFLAECYRVLRPSGTIRIIVPDAGRYLEAYNSEGWERIEALRMLQPEHADSYFPIKFRSKMELVNFVFRQGEEHKFAHDLDSLRVLLSGAGFIDIEQMTYGVSRDSVLSLDLKSREHESLYVEAIKPA